MVMPGQLVWVASGPAGAGALGCVDPMPSASGGLIISWGMLGRGVTGLCGGLGEEGVEHGAGLLASFGMGGGGAGGGDLGVDAVEDFFGLDWGGVRCRPGRACLGREIAFQAGGEGFLGLVGGAVEVVGAAAEADLLGRRQGGVDLGECQQFEPRHAVGDDLDDVQELRPGRTP